MLPGKMATKKAAKSIPTVRRCGCLVASIATPKEISATPEASTTKSLSSGKKSGTCA